MSNDTIEIKITADNAQAINAVKQFADFVKQVSGQTNADGAKSGNGFIEAFAAVSETGAKVVSVLDKINSTVNKIANAFRPVGSASKESMVAVSEGANKVANNIDTVRSKLNRLNGTGIKIDVNSNIGKMLVLAQQVTSAINSLGEKIKEFKLLFELSMNQVSADARTASKQIVAAFSRVKIPSINPRAPSAPALPSVANSSQQAVQNVGNPFESANAGGRGFLDTLSKISMAAYGIVGILETIKSIVSKIFGTGVEFDTQMETSQMGIAAMLASMTTWNGKQMDINTAMGVAKTQLDDINQKAAAIGLKSTDLTAGFQSIIGPGLKAKMTLEEIINLSVMGTKAVKTTLGAQGNAMQVSQELRSMVSGQIDQNSTVARELGITNEGVNQAKQTAGGLFAYLEEKMSGFQALAASEWPNSMTGIMESFKAKFEQSSGSAFESVFDLLKTKLKVINDYLFTINETTKKVSFNPEILAQLKSFVNYFILFTEKIIAAGKFVSVYLLAPLGGVSGVLAFIINNLYGVTTALATWAVIRKFTTAMDNYREATIKAIIETQALGTTGTTTGTKMVAGTVSATVAMGRMEAAIGAVKIALRGLASATLWGAIAMAAGWALEKVINLLDKTADAKNKISDNKTSITGDTAIGALSAKWEASGDPGAVNEASNGDPGGRSYGKYQINSDNIEGFVNWLVSNGWDVGKYLKYGENTNAGIPAHDVAIGSDEFVSLFKTAGDDYGDSFGNAQTAWAIEKYYEPLKQLLNGDGFNLDDHSIGVRQAAMSTAIQHGTSASDIIEEAANKDGVNNDTDLINAIYDIRSRYIANDKYIPQKMKDNIINNRFNGDVSERADALSNNNGGWNGQSASGHLNQEDIARQLELKQQQEEKDAAYYKNQQDIMQASIAKSKYDVESKLADIEDERKALKVKYDNADISEPDYKSQNAVLDYKSQQVKTEGVAREKEIVANTDIKDALSKSTKLTDLDREYDKQARALKDFGDVVNDTAAIMNAFKGATTLSEEGSTWDKKDDADVTDLTDNAKGALTAISAKYKELTGENLLVTEGFSNDPIHQLGGHNSGNKMDITEKFGSTILQDNKNGIRDKIKAYAESIGVQVGDEYSDPSPNSTGPHLDLNASGFNLPIEEAVKSINGKALTMTGIEIMKSIEALQSELSGYIETLNSYKGNVSLVQKQQIKAKYQKLIEKYTNAGMSGAVSQLQTLENLDLTTADFDQTKKEIEQSNTKLALSQLEFINQIKDGSMSAADAVDAIKKESDTAMKQRLVELNNQLWVYNQLGATDKADEISALMKKLKDNAKSILEDTIKALNEKIQIETDEINANPNFTTGMKTSRINDLKRQQYTADALAQYTAASAKGTSPADSAWLRRLAAINAELGRTKTLMENVYNAGQQGLESGLTAFFESGYQSCKKLTDAIEDLALSIVTEMNKVFANQLVKNLMNQWFGGNTSSRPSVNGVAVQGPLKLDGTFADGGSLDSGNVTGAGTGTSDSILAYLGNYKKFVKFSNGEYVIRTAAARKLGKRVLDNLNNGLIPSGFGEVKAKYASGGSLSGRPSVGASDVAASLTNNNSVSVPLKVVNITDPNEISKHLQTREGERVLVNFVKNNSSMIKHIIE